MQDVGQEQVCFNTVYAS